MRQGGQSGPDCCHAGSAGSGKRVLLPGCLCLRPAGVRIVLFASWGRWHGEARLPVLRECEPVASGALLPQERTQPEAMSCSVFGSGCR